MTTERLDIITRERGAKKAAGNISNIGVAARSANKGIALMTAGIAGLAAVGVARKVIGLANSFQQLENQVRVAVGETGDLNGTMNELFRVADKTRAPVEAMVQLYQRGSLAANELGASQKELIDFTETVGTALALQGGSAEQASGALLQLSQSLGSGIVRAEEFNSILEGAFPIAKAAAAGIDEAGGSVAKLRQLIVEGKVTSDVFFRGILSQSSDLKRQFAATETTVTQALQRIKNNFIQAAGSGNLSPLVESLEDFADVIADPAFQQAFGNFVSGIVTLASKGVQALAAVGELGQGLGIAIARFQGFEDADDGIAVLDASIRDLNEELQDLIDAQDGFSLKRGLLGDYDAEADAKEIARIENSLRQLTEARAIALAEFQATPAPVVEAASGGPSGPKVEPIDEKLLGQQKNFLEGLRTQNEELAIQVRLGDAAAAALARYATEQEISALQLGPEQAAQARALTEAIIGQNQAIEDQQNLGEQRSFIQSLEEQAMALEVQADAGDDAAAALRLYNVEQQAALLGGPEFVALALDIANGINEQEAALRRLATARDDANVITDLQREAELIGLSNRERAIEIELRRLSADATAGQVEQVRELAGALFDEQEKLQSAAITTEEFLKETARSIQQTLAGGLANALTEGFDDLPRQFAKVLLQLSSQFLASAIFQQLSTLGQNNSGGFLKAIGSFFGGGFATGGSFQVPGSGGTDSQLVSFKATPGEKVSVNRPGRGPADGGNGGNQQPIIVPPAKVTMINTIEKSEITGAFNDGSGDQVLLNRISAKRGSFRKALGV